MRVSVFVCIYCMLCHSVDVLVLKLNVYTSITNDYVSFSLYYVSLFASVSLIHSFIQRILCVRCVYAYIAYCVHLLFAADPIDNNSSGIGKTNDNYICNKYAPPSGTITVYITWFHSRSMNVSARHRWVLAHSQTIFSHHPFSM